MMQRLWDHVLTGPVWAHLPVRAWAVVTVVAVLAMVPGFFNLPVTDRDEARYAQAARQMMETGDYVDIRFQDKARHVKPVGIYWLQVVTATPFGGAQAPIWAHRLPSLFAALLAVAATAAFTARQFGARAGLTAGIVLGACLMVGVEARIAKTDAVLLASATMAQIALFYVVRRAPPAGGRFWGWTAVFWAASGVALLVKGPIVAMVSATTLVVYGLWARDWRFVKTLRIVPGIGVLVAIAAPWLVAITIKTQGGFLAESVGHALLGKVSKGDDSHGAPPGYHAVFSLLGFWPWAVLLVPTALCVWANRHKDDIRFVVAWLVPTWVIFELVATKLPHYVAPAYPALAILAALGMAYAQTSGLRRWRGRIAHGVVVCLALMASLAIAGLAVIGQTTALGGGASPAAYVALATGLVATGCIGWFALSPSGGRLLLVAASAVLVYWPLAQFALPNTDGLWPSHRAARFVDTLNTSACETVYVASARYREPSLVFHFGTHTQLTDIDGMAGVLADHTECGLALITNGEAEAFTAAMANMGVSPLELGRVAGLNVSKGRDMTIAVMAHPNTVIAP